MNIFNYCGICRGNTNKRIFGNTQDIFSKESFKLQECEVCSLVTTDLNELRNPLTEYYFKEYRNFRGLRKLVLRRLYYGLVKKWLKRHEFESILEIGCGNGEMLHYARCRGLRVTGVEISKELVEKLKKEKNIDAYTSLSDTPKTQVDLVLMYNSIEHIAFPELLLDELKKRLSEKSRIIVTVPNIESYQSRILGPDWVHLDAPRHVTHFSKSTLIKLFEKSGFQVEKSTRGSWVYDLYGWIASLASSSEFRKRLQNIGTPYQENSLLNSKLLLKQFHSIPWFVVSILLTQLLRTLGDSALIEVHFRMSNNPDGGKDEFN